MRQKPSLIVPTFVLAAIIALNAPAFAIEQGSSQVTTEFSAAKKQGQKQTTHKTTTAHKVNVAHKARVAHKAKVTTHKTVTKTKTHTVTTNKNVLKHTTTTTTKTTTAKLTSGPGTLHHKMGKGPGKIGMTPKSKTYVNKFGKKVVVIHTGPNKYWNGASWVTFVALATLPAIYIGTEAFTPIGYVPLGGPYCAGFTEQGCRLRWQPVALVDGGEDLQCVAYCPPRVTVIDNGPVVIDNGGGEGNGTDPGVNIGNLGGGGNGGGTGGGLGGGGGGGGGGTGPAAGGGPGDGGAGGAGGGGAGGGNGTADGSGAGGAGNAANTNLASAGNTSADAAAAAAAAQNRGQCEVVVFAEPGLKGESAPTNEDQPRLGEVGWKYEIASLQVKTGTWDFYTDDDYGGTAMRLKPGSYAKLAPEWSKKIASFQCTKPE